VPVTDTITIPAPAEALPPPADLPLVETFHSLQGEGIHAGRSAFFLRLAGCDVGCPWCDTKVSWPESAHPRRSLAELATEAREAAEAGAAFAVITGGEPLQHNLTSLCAAIDAATAPCPGGPLPLHLETSGVHRLSGRFDWITLSPKRHRPPRAEVLAACHELKVVVHEPADLTFAVTMAEAARSRGTAASEAAAPALLLQPGWDSARGQELAVAFVRRHPDWRLSLQTHKLLGVR
jgi:organic radical activating enzyme